MAGTFTAQVEDWVAKSERLMTAVFRTALDSVVDDMQAPVGAGGRMHVDTGFLRASLSANIGESMPSGPSEKDIDPPGSPEAAKLVIGDAQAGDMVSLGYTAHYAQFREPLDGFVEGAAQKWPQFVDAAVNEAKRRVR